MVNMKDQQGKKIKLSVEFLASSYVNLKKHYKLNNQKEVKRNVYKTNH